MIKKNATSVFKNFDVILVRARGKIGREILVRAKSITGRENFGAETQGLHC